VPWQEAAIIITLPLVVAIIELHVLIDDAVVGDTSGGCNIMRCLAVLPALLGMIRRTVIVIIVVWLVTISKRSRQCARVLNLRSPLILTKNSL
jgi:hypothetical protein